MLSDDQFEIVRPKLNVLRIITGAMVMGVVFFAVISNVISPWTQATMKTSMLPLLGAAASLFSAVLAVILPALAAGSVPAPTEGRSPERLAEAGNIFLTGRIIRLALLEGGCFLNLVIFIIDHSKISLIAAAIGLFLLMLSFPTAWGMRRWMESAL